MNAPPRPQLPVAQKLRIKFAKRGRMRFASHRDFSRAFERALRRAKLPMAYSEGFNPHPKISYAGAAPTGTSSAAEFLEISLTEPVDLNIVKTELNAALPEGFDIETVEDAAGLAPLLELLQASHWQIELPGVDLATAQNAVANFLATEEILVERLTRKGIRRFDCRAAVVQIGVIFDRCAILDLVVRHETPAVRPDDVLIGLQQVGVVEPASAPKVHRIAQGPLDLWTKTSPQR